MAVRGATVAAWPRIALPFGIVSAGVFASFALAGGIAKARIGVDFAGYMAGWDRYLATGSPYTAVQLAGPYPVFSLQPDELFLHPPTLLALLAPFSVLPAILWWAVPIGVLGYVMASWRPAPWGWALVAALLLWPRSVGAFLNGNTDVWVAAGVAAGLRWGWPGALVLVKITMAPFALAGITHRSWWAGLAVVVAVSALFLPLWPQWVTSMRNGEGLGLAYSLTSMALPLAPVVAWVSRRGGAGRSPATAR